MAFDPITALANVANVVLSKVLPDKAAQDAGKLQLAEMALNGELQQYAAQIEVDKVEAASTSTFVAGWRPFVGWICGCGIAYEMIVRPLFTFVAGLFGSHVIAPAIETQDLIGLLTGMLGLAGMRTYEKATGATTTDGVH